MNILKCKTCKFWVKPVERDNWNARFICNPVDSDTYEKMKTNFEVRKCNSDKIVYFERQPESNWISLVDGSEYYAKMLTGEDYGCINHEALIKE